MTFSLTCCQLAGFDFPWWESPSCPHDGQLTAVNKKSEPLRIWVDEIQLVGVFRSFKVFSDETLSSYSGELKWKEKPIQALFYLLVICAYLSASVPIEGSLELQSAVPPPPPYYREPQTWCRHMHTHAHTCTHTHFPSHAYTAFSYTHLLAKIAFT